jgi:hypothetical protein
MSCCNWASTWCRVVVVAASVRASPAVTASRCPRMASRFQTADARYRLHIGQLLLHLGIAFLGSLQHLMLRPITSQIGCSQQNQNNDEQKFLHGLASFLASGATPSPPKASSFGKRAILIRIRVSVFGLRAGEVRLLALGREAEKWKRPLSASFAQSKQRAGANI